MQTDTDLSGDCDLTMSRETIQLEVTNAELKPSSVYIAYDSRYGS